MLNIINFIVSLFVVNCFFYYAPVSKSNNFFIKYYQNKKLDFFEYTILYIASLFTVVFIVNMFFKFIRTFI